MFIYQDNHDSSRGLAPLHNVYRTRVVDTLSKCWKTENGLSYSELNGVLELIRCKSCRSHKIDVFMVHEWKRKKKRLREVEEEEKVKKEEISG